MVSILLAKLIPYKTLIYVGLVLSVLFGGWFYVNNLHTENLELTEANTTLTKNNEILNNEKTVWVNAMEEQVQLTSTLKDSNLQSHKSLNVLRNKLNKLKLSFNDLDGSIESNQALSIEFTRQLTNSYNCISKESGVKSGCIQ